MKKRLWIFVAALILAGCLILCACNDDGEVLVESIAVTDMPVTQYYRGDYFNLNGAKITVYYKDGRTEVIPLTESMISEFDAQSVCEQILSVRYGGATTYISVNVIEAPVYSIQVKNGGYKVNYVQGQVLDVENMILEVTYVNGYTETVPVTASMVGNFDTSVSGERQLVISYGDKTTTVNINVVSRGILAIEVYSPDRTTYVVGDKIDFTGGRIYVSYNNNTGEFLNIPEILNDGNFSYQINGEETDTFTTAGNIVYVTLSYFGHTAEYIVTAEALRPDKLEILSTPPDQPRNSQSADLSGGVIRVSYNNGTFADVPMTDERVFVDWGEFDVTRNGVYTISFTCEGLNLSYDIRVVEPVEKELLVDIKDEIYYQDGRDIDITKWTYSVLLTNGGYRVFNENGVQTTTPSVTLSMLDGEYDFTTSDSGEKSFTLFYTNADGTVRLTKEVKVEVIEKKFTEIKDFRAPDRLVYNRGDVLSLVGGGYYPVYNDGSVGEWTALYSDALTEEIGSYTQTIRDGVRVEFLLKDARYGGEVGAFFTINVVKKAVSLSYNAVSSVGLKLKYVKGESFDCKGLVVDVVYDDSTRVQHVNFEGSEWSFANATFNTVGNATVRIYYGDVAADALYAEIPVVVTNDVKSVSFADGFESFGSVIEGMAIAIPDNAFLTVTLENGDTETVKITADMLDYDRNDLILSEAREVKVAYLGFELVSSVEVVSRSVQSVRIDRVPDKLAYVKGDGGWNLDGMVLFLLYDNGISLRINGAALNNATVDGNYETYNLTVAERTITVRIDKLNTEIPDGKAYLRQTATVRVTDEIGDTYGETAFDAVCFEKLITSLSFFTQSQQTLPLRDRPTVLPAGTVYENGALKFQKDTVGVYETEELKFPADAGVKVVYEDGTEEKVLLSSVSAEDYSVSGFDRMKSGYQSVKLEYLLSECSFTVYVAPKILADITVAPEELTVIEGVPLNSADMEIKLHYLRADGTEYAGYDGNGYRQEIELSNVNCTFNPNAEFNFNGTENGVGYSRGSYEISYSYGGVTVSASVTIKVLRKSVVSASMQRYPTKQVYIEGERDISYDGGVVLVIYDNGTSELIDLTSDRLSIFSNEFDTSELDFGGESRQTIRVVFTDLNNREAETSYVVTVKDRKYLEIEYEIDPVNNLYTFEYGADSSRRPRFTLYGYVNFNDLNASVLADCDNIDGKDGFSVYYLNSDGTRINSFPTEVGIYTFVISYDGDGSNNPFIDDTRRIEIYAKNLALVAENKEFVYGEVVNEGAEGYTWVLKGYTDTVNGPVFTDNPLCYGDAQESVLEAAFSIYNEGGSEITFFTDDGRTVISANAGKYELRPSVAEMISSNYRIAYFRSGELTVNKREIRLVSADYEKIYGDDDPRFNRYTVYDKESGVKIGENGAITFGDIYTDSLNLYTLRRETKAGSENVGEHAVIEGAAALMPNYSVKSYQEGKLVIKPRAITLNGEQLGERKYGQHKSAESTEYGFSVADGFSMAVNRQTGINDNFEEVFAGLFNYVDEVNAGRLSVKIKNPDGTNYPYGSAPAPLANADAGIYKIKVSINSGIAGNYDVTIEEFDYEIKPMDVEIVIRSAVHTYSQILTESVYAGDKVVYDGNYAENYGEGYVYYNSKPQIVLVKNKGVDTGRYEITVPEEIKNLPANKNFVLTVKGDYGEFYNNYFADRQDIASLMKTNFNEEDNEKAFAVILPYEFGYSFERSEIYDRKTVMKPAVEFDFGENIDFSEDTENGIYGAFKFTFTNKTPSKANYGYFTADGYEGRLTYDYFADAQSRNFIIEGLGAGEKAIIFDYCFGGAVDSETVLYSLDFDYEIKPKPLAIEILNTDAGYTGDAIGIQTDTAYLDEVKAGDNLNLTYDIKVVYYDTTVQTTAEDVLNAGDYTVSLAGVGNYNYELAQEAIKEFTVNTVVLDVVIDSADENGRVLATYTGRGVQPLSNDWQKTDNPSEGYFKTTTQRIVNETSLTSVPRGLTIRPFTYDIEGNEIVPVNVNPDGYSFKDTVNSEFKNYSVRYVKQVGDGIYEACEYKLFIQPRPVSVMNLSRVNYKEYDGREPSISTDAQLAQIIVPDVAIDKKDLKFEFVRDTDYVPVGLEGYFDGRDGDMTSAGRFSINITSKSGNHNYTFTPDEEYYYINRVQVGITLNTNNFTLSKQFDIVAPTASREELIMNKNVRDEIYFELDAKYVLDNGSWTAYTEGENGIGIYAYDFRAAIENGDNRIFDVVEEYADGGNGSGYKLLSWNYIYYINAYTGDSNGCDGVYTIEKKDVSIDLGAAAAEETRIIGAASPAVYYVYGHVYDMKTVSGESAQNEINDSGVFRVVDADGNEIDYALFGFRKQTLTVGGASSVLNAGDYFTVDFTANVESNPNFNILNKPILYAVKQREVDLKLTYFNSEDASVNVYGSKDISKKIIDFADKAAFLEALGIDEADEKANISFWLSDNAGADYANNKFIIENAVYYLTDANGTYDIRGGEILAAGIYSAYATGIMAQNFTFTVTGADFEITPRNIFVRGAHRDYFDKSSLIIDWDIEGGSVNDNTERALINAILAAFNDNNSTAADAGENYFIEAGRIGLSFVEGGYPNYKLIYSEKTPADGDGNYLYIGLTINKLPVKVSVSSVGGQELSFNYGTELNYRTDFVLSYDGMPVLRENGGYDYAAELTKQNQVKETILSFVDLEELKKELKSINASDSRITRSLRAFLSDGADLTLENYELSFEIFGFNVNRIVLSLNLINRAGSKYNSEGRFSILADERNRLVYSEDGEGRFDYGFEIAEPNSIVGYTAGMTLREQLALIWQGTLPDDYGSLVKYSIKQRNLDGILGDDISAGLCELALTDDWYRSNNYVLHCTPAEIMLYPKTLFMGDDVDNHLPFTAVSLTGNPNDYNLNLTDRLSMLVKLNYLGMPAGKESEWVDIRSSSINEIFLGAGYSREWKIDYGSYGGDEITKPHYISAGDAVKLKLTLTEKFYTGTDEELVNTFVSAEFSVRIYGMEDALVKDRSTSDFFDATNGSVSSFADAKTTDGAYYLTDAKGSENKYYDKFDIIGADFILGTKGADSYSYEIILHEKKNKRLSLGFAGGRDYGFYVRLYNTDTGVDVDKTVLKEYKVTGSEGKTVDRSVLSDVNMFDGKKHTVTAYVDKVGYLDRENSEVLETGVTRISRYYRVTFVVDNRYSYTVSYRGRQVEETYYDNGKVSVSYYSDVEFGYEGDLNTDDWTDAEVGKGNTGFVLNNCTAIVTRFSLKTMGIGARIVDGFDSVTDLRITPATEGALLYVDGAENIASVIDAMTFNSNAGYDGRYSFTYRYFNVINGNEVAATDLDAGLYRVAVNLALNGSVIRETEIFVCIVEDNETDLKFNFDDGQVYEAREDSPAHIDGKDGVVGFTARQSGIDFTKLVFDFEDDMSTSVGLATFILKSETDEIYDFSSVNMDNDGAEEKYRGISIAISRNADGTYATQLHFRLGEKYWRADIGNIEWRGKRNVLEARYDKETFCITVTLSRGTETLFRFRVNPYRSPENVLPMIRHAYDAGVAESFVKVSSFVGIRLYGTEVTLYSLETTESRQKVLNLFETDTASYASGSYAEEIIEVSGVTRDNRYGRLSSNRFIGLSAGNGLPLATSTKNTYFKFSSDTNFRLMFVNNTPFITNRTNVNAANDYGERGAFLEFDGGAINMSFYKNANIYRRQQLATDLTLLDGNEHEVVICITDETENMTAGAGSATVNVPCTVIKIYIDGNGKTYTALIPKINSLPTMQLYGGGSEVSDNNSENAVFLPEERYVGVMPFGTGTLNIKDLIVF